MPHCRKRISRPLFTFLLCLGCLPARAQPPGDLDGDGLVTVNDAVDALRITIGLPIDTPVPLLVNGDVQADCAIDVNDAVDILRMIVGLYPSPPDGALPGLTGKLAFQRSSPSPGDDQPAPEDAELLVYDFAERRLTCPSIDWHGAFKTNNPEIVNAINPSFSADRTTVTFTAILTRNGKWIQRDIFSWKVGDTHVLTNLTDDANKDEDPKFYKDRSGKEKIVFKRDTHGIVVMDPDGNNLRLLKVMADATHEDTAQKSAPYYWDSPGGEVFVFAKGEGGADSDLYSVPIEGGQETPLANLDLYESYAIVWGGDFFYTRWLDGTMNDQIYAFRPGDNASTSCRLLFNTDNNNTSDPYPLNDHMVFFSGMGRKGGKGVYDLYVGDTVTGQDLSLDDLAPGAGINSSKEELGASYSESFVGTPSMQCK